MSYTKTKIYNLALSALLLSRQVSDTETDKITNEVRVLNLFWDDALTSTLQELDIDSLSESITLELLEDLGQNNRPWQYIYKYPDRCAFLRRITSCVVKDTRRTYIDKAVKLYQGQRVIYTNEYQAVIECIPKDISLNALTSPAAMAIAYYLAWLATPLNVGKGAARLRKEIWEAYQVFLSSAQELDSKENFTFDPSYVESEFVRVRLS